MPEVVAKVVVDTPGPWLNAGRLGHGILIATPVSQIAVVYGPAVNPEAEVNANLIAAAPELYRALKLILKAVADRSPKTKMPPFAVRAIAKAEGRQDG